MPIRLTFATLTLLSSVAAAQDTTLSPWKYDTLASTALGEQRSFIVATPEGYGAMPERRYPVLVLLDANDVPQFRAAVANASFLASRSAIPEIIIVGVPNGKDRTRDLTPVATGPNTKTFPTAGGAGKMAEFLTEELLPLVRSKYRTYPMAMLAGHSFGGLFALHVAASRPSAFQGVIAMSPSLWWNDTTAVAAYADSIVRAKEAPRLFVTSGALEPPIDVTAKRFVARLKASKTRTPAVASRHYSQDDHGLTPAPSLADGLRFIFEPVSLPRMPIARLLPGSDSAAIERMLYATDRQYARGARSLGLPEAVPEAVLNQAGYFALEFMKKTDFAISLFRRNVERYPESANVYDSLADALLAKGDTASARVELRKAIDVAMRTGHTVLATSRQKLEAIEGTRQAGKAQP